MKEISSTKKWKVIKLFFDGFSYDEIAAAVGISKGSVFKIIDTFRNGELVVNMACYALSQRQPVDYGGYNGLRLLGKTPELRHG